MNNTVHGQTSPNDVYKKKANALNEALTQAQSQIKNTNPVQPAQANNANQQTVQSAAQSNTVGTSQVNPNHTRVETTQNTSAPTQQAQKNIQSNVAYDNNVDYSKLISNAVAAGNYYQAAIYEQQRNAKIAKQNLPYEQTNTYTKYLPSYDNSTDYSKLINDAVAAGDYYQAALYEQQRNTKIALQNLPYQQTSTYAAYLPGGTKFGTVQTSENDMSPLINQIYDAKAEQIKGQVNSETQGAVDQLNRALQDAQPTYEAAIANQLLETKQAQDAQALRNQVNGDRGGIGSAQVTSIGNTGAKNREAIAQQQRQLATDTARQIADLRAQGKFQEANLLLQNSQQKLSALYEEQVRLQQQQAEQDSILANLATQYLSSGIMPSDDMLAVLGIDESTAQKYIDFYATQQNMQKDSETNSILRDLATQYLSAGLMPSNDMLAALGIDAATAQKYIDAVVSQNAAKSSSGSSSSSSKKLPEYTKIQVLRELQKNGEFEELEFELRTLEKYGYDRATIESILGVAGGYDIETGYTSPSTSQNAATATHKFDDRYTAP